MGRESDGIGVTFALFDDNFADHPKVVVLSDGAFRLHASGIIYCARHLTDGVVLKVKVKALTPEYKPSHLKELVDAGLWHRHPEGYEIHDYLEWNNSKAQIQARRDSKKAAGKKGAKNRWHKD